MIVPPGTAARAAALTLVAVVPVRRVSPGPWPSLAGSWAAVDAEAVVVAEPLVAAPAMCEPARIPPATRPLPTSAAETTHLRGRAILPASLLIEPPFAGRRPMRRVAAAV